MRPLVPILAALLTLGTLLPGDAEARKPREEPAVAAWPVSNPEIHRTEGARWYAEFIDAVDGIDALRVDEDRLFLPDVAPSEGAEVAIGAARRLSEGAWQALRAAEPDRALQLVTEAEGLVDPYGAERLPEGMARDLVLLRARAQLAAGEPGPAGVTLLRAMGMDPSWKVDASWDHPDFVRLAEEADKRRKQAPGGRVTFSADAADVRVLFSGVEQGRVFRTELSLELPPGRYRVTGRKAGHADDTRELVVRPKEELTVGFQLAPENSAGFQLDVLDALDRPREQRRATVWQGLRTTAGLLDARAILVGRFLPDPGAEEGGVLQVGLYLPGLTGWGFHRTLLVTDDEEATADKVQEAAAGLREAVLRSFQPPALAQR